MITHWSGTRLGTALALCLAVSIAAASPVLAADPSTPAAKHGDKFTVAFVPGVARNIFYQTMKAPAEAEARKLGIRLIWEAGATFSPEVQVPILQSLLAKRPSALVVAPTDPVALKASVQAFVRAGIPVITVDTTLADASLITCAITSDSSQGGELAAKLVGKFAHGAGATFAMGADPHTTTLVLRANGFLAGMKAFPEITVLPTQYDHHSLSNAASITSSLLISHPTIIGIFGTNNHAAEGIANAVTQAGKKGKVIVVGFDADPTEVRLLKEGVISALIIQNPAEEAQLAVKYAYDYLTGRKSVIPKSVTLKNIIATTATANDPSVSKYYYGSR